ncbi:MerR family transcriptional regulator [Nocardia huaxiensis]|uniref:MerR family transcriptional regulator n=1 Tax=Nocardia huaxiensis TaxID=2755382 RepID=A0A7D6VI00_9NOCA|nr:MerR family transcriptional regulator [Nocardia huaxiensis]QLY33275.1 MerR family transcriptional regulator [Nocardia huaxiensis]
MTIHRNEAATAPEPSQPGGIGTRLWADTKEAAQIIHCHPEVLRRWHREGSAPFDLPKPKRRGRRYLWNVGALHAAMEAMHTDEGSVASNG